MEKALAEKMIDLAIEQLNFSYTPYSHFTVGAALLTYDGNLYGGCNIENAAYGPTNCAERTAVFSAVARGEREFAAIAVVGKFTDGSPAGGDGLPTPAASAARCWRSSAPQRIFWCCWKTPRGSARPSPLGSCCPTVLC